MKKFILPLLLTSFCAPAFAESNFYQSIAYTCSNKTFVSDWHIERSGDTLDIVGVITDQSNGRITRGAWTKEFANTVELEDKRGDPQFSLQNMDTPSQIKIDTLDRRGQKNLRCSDMAIRTVDGFEQRISAYEALLTQNSISPETVDQVLALRSTLPPFELLPEAQIPAQKGKINYAESQFWERYGRQQTKLAADPQTPDLDITRAISEVFRIVANVDDKDLKQRQRDAAAQIQIERSDRVFLAGRDPIEYSNQDPTVICNRLPLLGRRVSSDDFMINMSGMALEYWTQNFSNQMVSFTSACPGGKRVSASIEKYWPKIEKKQKAMQVVLTERDRLLSQRRTIGSLRKANWLTIDLKNQKRGGITQQEVTRFAEPVLVKARAESIAPLRVELVDRLNDRTLDYDQLETICFDLHGGYKQERTLAAEVFKDCDEQARNVLDEKLATAVEIEENLVRDDLPDAKIQLFDMSGYCRRRAKKLTETKIYVTQALNSACQRASAAHFKEDFMDTFNRRIKRIKNSTPNIDALRRNNWFNFDEDFSAAPKEQPYLVTAIKEIEDTIYNLPETILRHRDIAVRNAVSEVQDSYAAADPLEKSDDEARELCTDIPKNMGEYLRPLITACTLAEAEMNTKRERKQCARVWDRVPNSAQLQTGFLVTPNGFNDDRNPIRVLFCQVGEQNAKFSITYEKRFLSSTHQVTRRVPNFQGSGTTVKLRANFTEADDGFNAWELTKGVVIYPNGTERNLANQGANLALCLFTPRICARS